MTTVSDPTIRRRIAALLGIAPHRLDDGGSATPAERRAFDEAVAALARIQTESAQTLDALTTAAAELMRTGLTVSAALIALRSAALTSLAAGAPLDETVAVTKALISQAGLAASQAVIAWDRLFQSTLTDGGGNDDDRPLSLRALAADLPRLLGCAPALGLHGLPAVDTIGAAAQVLLRGQGRPDTASDVMIAWLTRLPAGSADPIASALQDIARDGLPPEMPATSPLGAMLNRASARLDLYATVRSRMAAAEDVVSAVAATVYRPPSISGAVNAALEAAGLVPAQLARLGRFGFGLSTLAYSELRRATQWRWPAQDRIGRAPALQYVGPGSDEITLPATLYPWWRGGLGQISALRAIANEGLPLLLTLSDGQVLGFWVITRIEETGRVFGRGGMPRAIDIQLSLAFHGDDHTATEAA